MKIENLVLNPSFSVHVWVLQKGTGDMSIFSKDKDDFATTESPMHVYCYLEGTTKQPVIKLTKDDDKSIHKKVTGPTGLPTGWNYVVFSAEMSLGKDTTLKIWVNKVQQGLSIATSIFVRDLAAYKAYIGVVRTTGATTYSDKMEGFIYELHLW
jgi:hypothetical protein